MVDIVEEAELEYLLYRIIEGYIEFDGFPTRDPSFRIKSYGQNVYFNVLKECLRDPECLTERDVYILLLNLKEWSPKQEEDLKKLPRIIENNKLDYFHDFFISERKKSRKIVLETNMKKFLDLSVAKHKYDNLLPQNIANGAMWHAMITKMHSGPKKLAALTDYHNRFISENTIRDIALSSEWNTYSSISKNPLGRPSIKMTDYQKKLYAWTNVYRNIKSHPECPPEAIIHDHLAFDGWMIDQNRKERANKSNKIPLKGIKENAQNVYIMTRTDEGADDIMSLNDAKARAKLEALYNKIDETAKK